MPYRQVLRVKCIHSTIEHFALYCSQLKQKFIKKGYKSDLLYKHITTVEKLDQNEMLKVRVTGKPRQSITLTILTHNCFYSNISKKI